MKWIEKNKIVEVLDDKEVPGLGKNEIAYRQNGSVVKVNRADFERDYEPYSPPPVKIRPKGIQ